MRTCTTMIYADDKVSRFAVLVGRMKGRAFDAHTATRVATYELPAGHSWAPGAFERWCTLSHATAAAPAVYWLGVGK